MLSKAKIKLIRSLDTKKNRSETGLFLAEGQKLVAELLPVFRCRFLAGTAAWMEAHAPSAQAEWEMVSEAELKQASLLRAPQEVLALFEIPQWPMPHSWGGNETLVLALDDVQDPGNLGTIVRIADWFGIRDVICSAGTADVYNPKAVQATMGALARVRMHYVDLPNTLRNLPAGTPIMGTVLDGQNIYQTTLPKGGILVMGNEGNGLSQQVRALLTDALFIPSFPPGEPTSESLNVSVATAVACAEFRRRAIHAN